MQDPKSKSDSHITVYDRVYHTPGYNILGFGILSPGVVYRGGVVYTVPPVIKWVVVWDFRLFTTPGGIPQGCDNMGGDNSGFKRVLLSVITGEIEAVASFRSTPQAGSKGCESTAGSRTLARRRPRALL